MSLVEVSRDQLLDMLYEKGLIPAGVKTWIEFREPGTLIIRYEEHG